MSRVKRANSLLDNFDRDRGGCNLDDSTSDARKVNGSSTRTVPVAVRVGDQDRRERRPINRVSPRRRRLQKQKEYSNRVDLAHSPQPARSTACRADEGIYVGLAHLGKQPKSEDLHRNMLPESEARSLQFLNPAYQACELPLVSGNVVYNPNVFASSLSNARFTKPNPENPELHLQTSSSNDFLRSDNRNHPSQKLDLTKLCSIRGGEDADFYSFRTPWWQVPAQCTIIRRAMDRSVAPPRHFGNQVVSPHSCEDEMGQVMTKATSDIRRLHISGERIAKPYLNSSTSPAHNWHTHGASVFSTLNQEPQALTRAICKLTRKLRARIFALVIWDGVGSTQLYRGSTGKQESISQRDAHPEPLDTNETFPSPSGFLKLTASEKKAFYSTPKMNRIASSSGANHLAALDTAQRSPLGGGGDRVTFGDPRTFGYWCSSAVSTSARNLQITVWDPLSVTARQLEGIAMRAAPLYVLQREVEMVEQRLLAFEDLRDSWVRAMARLPQWVENIRVWAVVAEWMDAREVEVTLARLRTCALFRTAGRVRWVEGVVKAEGP